MPQVNISINGRDYLLNCGEGEQERLHQVTNYISDKIASLDRVTKQSGDANLMLTAALLASNEVLDLREEIERLSKDVHQSQQAERSASERAHTSETAAVEAFTKLSHRIEQLATSMGEQEQPAFKAEGPAA